MSTERALLIQLVQKINEDRLVLPSLPEVAMNVRNLALEDECSLADLAKEISKDPALAVRLVALANSAAFGTSIKADSVTFAVSRLGLEKTRDLASAVAMHQLFYSEHKMTWEVLEQQWQSNIDVACCALALLACQHERGQLVHLTADTLLLACQIHNIGALPVLEQAERHPHLFQDKAQLLRMIQLMRAPLGKAVLEHWQFPRELIEVARYWSDMSFQTPAVSYLDLVRLSALYTRQWVLPDPLSSSLELFVRKGVIPDLEIFGMETYFLSFNEVRASFNVEAHV
ncbi:HDOD domain-containing protein [Ferrimonas pelagia]|uniref:HDOD domain-containing protein n=1 Tax=Ferrimonas pelagia TaxID=1177826 RepID=A0ABP9EIN1_9GAMM